MFEHDFKLRVNVKDGQPAVSIIGGPISYGELRVVVKLINDEYDKYLKEKRNVRRVETVGKS